MSISRRNFLRGASIVAGVAVVSTPSLLLANDQKKLETIEAIMTRRSIRSFTDQQVSADFCVFSLGSLAGESDTNTARRGLLSY